MIIWFDKSAMNKIMTPTKAADAIVALQAIIDTLLGAAAQAALNANMKEYSFDDGQTKTRVEYVNVGAIAAQIKALISLQEIYLQMPGMNSRVIRLIDSKNMPNMGWPCLTTTTTCG